VSKLYIIYKILFLYTLLILLNINYYKKNNENIIYINKDSYNTKIKNINYIINKKNINLLKCDVIKYNKLKILIFGNIEILINKNIISANIIYIYNNKNKFIIKIYNNL